MLAADYSQIELRIMAHLSGDEACSPPSAGEPRRAQRHRGGGPRRRPGFRSAEQRRKAKAINFGLIYGMSAFGLARQLGIERGEAQRYIDLYFARYPGVREYMDAPAPWPRAGLRGDPVRPPAVSAQHQPRNKMRQQAAERTAINAPMQGTAADIIKRAMIDVDAGFARSSRRCA
jgi:DNA polymerase-1